MKNKKLLFVASPGGHLVQLGLIAECFEDVERVIVSTYKEKPAFLHGDNYLRVEDFSRDNPHLAFKVLIQCFRILRLELPDLVVTTGAAPGLIMVIVSRFLRVRCIWVDSIANSKSLSLSGKIASRLGVSVISQWKEVSDDSNLIYRGRVI
jgi:UDP-N-acetylglucosamine:LPS N-acetylglucosamine transferase